MIKTSLPILKKATIIAVGSLLLPMTAQAANCGIDFQHAYESGVSNGRIDGSHKKSNDPSRHRHRVFSNVDDGKDRAKCYVKGYNTGYENAYADAKKAHSHKHAPAAGTNERAYFDDGCHAGTSDAQAGMSRAYDRHANDYDRRFESYFRQGYTTCWNHYR